MTDDMRKKIISFIEVENYQNVKLQNIYVYKERAIFYFREKNSSDLRSTVSTFIGMGEEISNFLISSGHIFLEQPIVYIGNQTKRKYYYITKLGPNRIVIQPDEDSDIYHFNNTIYVTDEMFKNYTRDYTDSNFKLIDEL